MTALGDLERVAAQRGWRLRWTSEPLRAAPRLTCTELDVFKGKRLLTSAGPYFTIHAGPVEPRERLARQALGQP